MKKIYFIILVGILTTCSDDEKAIEVVTEEIERGAVLRNITRIQNNFEAGDLTSAFAVEIEEQDEEDGALLDFVRVSGFVATVAFDDITIRSLPTDVK
ncbi:MAG: hypothetical protein OSB51_08170, partial [Dokdonia donghaensis]|nr:hypothetical protein [Dokdonia donghaensis]